MDLDFGQSQPGKQQRSQLVLPDSADACPLAPGNLASDDLARLTVARVFDDVWGRCGIEAKGHNCAVAHCDNDVSEIRRIAFEAASNHRPPAGSLYGVCTGDLAPSFIKTDQPEDMLWMIGVGKSGKLSGSLGVCA